MASANHPPQPPTKRQDAPQVAEIITPRHTPQSQAERQATDQAHEILGAAHSAQRTTIQPLRGSLYAVGTKHAPRIAKPEFRMSINQFDNHRNRFFDVIERVRFLDADGVMVNRIILDVGGLIVQIVAHDDSPRTVIVMIGEDVRMIRRAALIFIFLHLAKRMQHEHAQNSGR